MKKAKYIRFGIIFLLPLAVIFSQCLNKTTLSDPRGSAYAGSAACMKCHRDIAQNYLHMAHFLTSRAATAASVHGSFLPDSNTVIYNDSVKVVMEKHPDGLYQTKYINGKLKEQQRFDMVFGSWRAETYLSWKGDEARQLPVTYYISLHKWANSPGGYYGDSVNFSRVIHRRCFECHASYVENLGGDNSPDYQSDSLNKSTLVMGINCERCHGPAAQHVSFHTQNPDAKQPMYITRISSLTRARRMDLCSVCHSGNTDVMLKPTFDFKPGDTLENYSSGGRLHRFQDVKNVDVHGNQVKLLTNSKCFMSSNMECATCHKMHDAEIKTVATYSQYCTACHNEAKHNFCKLATQIGPAISSNCIDCHMPVKSSQTVVISGTDKTATPPFLARTHLITIYPEETQKIMAMLKAGQVKIAH